jgi:predicted DNA-binding WGR domain protein
VNDERRFNRYAEKKAGTNNKFYQVEVEELEDGRAKVYFTYGRIGTDGRRLDQGFFASYEGGVRVAKEQFAKKRQRGYVEVNAMQALASAAQELHERKTNGLEKVKLVIPKFFAGKSEKRCQDLCKKYEAKLNIVRASKHDLGWDAFYEQITAVLKQYCAEWRRMQRTKAHGHLVDNAAAQTGFRLFFTSMTDNAGCVPCGYFEGVGVH